MRPKLETQKQLPEERATMRYRTNHGLLIEAETSLDIVRRLREASWNEQGLSDRAFMEAVADRMYEQGIHVSTVSHDIFVAGLLSAGLLTREIEGTRSNETGKQIDN
jgi:DNA-binding transcriptional ArsR family regulator